MCRVARRLLGRWRPLGAKCAAPVQIRRAARMPSLAALTASVTPPGASPVVSIAPAASGFAALMALLTPAPNVPPVKAGTATGTAPPPPAGPSQAPDAKVAEPAVAATGPAAQAPAAVPAAPTPAPSGDGPTVRADGPAAPQVPQEEAPPPGAGGGSPSLPGAPPPTVAPPPIPPTLPAVPPAPAASQAPTAPVGVVRPGPTAGGAPQRVRLKAPAPGPAPASLPAGAVASATGETTPRTTIVKATSTDGRPTPVRASKDGDGLAAGLAKGAPLTPDPVAPPGRTVAAAAHLTPLGPGAAAPPTTAQTVAPVPSPPSTSAPSPVEGTTAATPDRLSPASLSGAPSTHVGAPPGRAEAISSPVRMVLASADAPDPAAASRSSGPAAQSSSGAAPGLEAPALAAVSRPGASEARSSSGATQASGAPAAAGVLGVTGRVVTPPPLPAPGAPIALTARAAPSTAPPILASAAPVAPSRPGSTVARACASSSRLSTTPAAVVSASGSAPVPAESAVVAAALPAQGAGSRDLGDDDQGSSSAPAAAPVADGGSTPSPPDPFVAAAPPPTVSTAAPVPAVGHATVAGLAAEIVRQSGRKASRFDVTLDPDGLGRVDVRLQIAADGRLSARLSFDRQESAAALGARAGELQQALTQAGFDVPPQSLSFETSSGGFGGGFQGFQDFGAGGEGGRGASRAFAAAQPDSDSVAESATRSSQAASGLDIRI